MYGRTADCMERARVLTDLKQHVLQAVIKSRGGTEMSTLGVQRKAATMFYQIAATEMNITRRDVHQLVKIYERFGESALRPKLESSFSVGELSMLASKSDAAIVAAMRMKNADPFLRRTELERRLNLEGH